MFSALDQVPGLGLPQFQTRKALIIINLQNDSLYTKGDFYIAKNPEFVPHLKTLIPYFRRIGDVVWVGTELGYASSATTTTPTHTEQEPKNHKKRSRKEGETQEERSQDETLAEEARRYKLPSVDPDEGTFPTYHPSSRIKQAMERADSETKAEKRSADMQIFDDKGNVMEDHLNKPRPDGQQKFFLRGTKGAEICDELLDVVDHSRDLMVTKHHYSAFDHTSLLMSLRMKLVTEVYLCGFMTNVGVYATAADAVQHGLQVSVVEDCLGYRNENKHKEAMRQMADIMGVNGIDVEEIVEESGGWDMPDANTPGLTLQELDLSAQETAEQKSLLEAGELNSRQGIVSQPETRADTPSGSLSRSAEHVENSNQLDTPQGRDSQGENVLAKPESTLNASPNPIATARNRGSWAKSRAHTVGPEDCIGSGDSRIIHNAIRSTTAKNMFNDVKEEVDWQSMFHRSGQVPRLVAVQGIVREDGDIPIYRHPADESPPLLPFTTTVQNIRQDIEKLLSQPFNHALIQLYRSGMDNISEHADKTLDIVTNSSIVNVSLGAQRMMTLRTKRSRNTALTDSPGTRQSQRVRMPHNSVFVLGPQTNREWLHGVRADKRPMQEKTKEEVAFGGERISITFRQIGTFMNRDKMTVWGSGAISKTKTKPGGISTADNAQMDRMIQAFGKENNQSDFDRDAEYGSGFNVIDLVNKRAKLILCNDTVANHRVQLSLCDKAIPYTVSQRDSTEEPNSAHTNRFKALPWSHGLSNIESPILKDPNQDGKETEGDLAILFHNNKQYPTSSESVPPTNTDIQSVSPGAQVQLPQNITARVYSLAAQSNELLYLWRELQNNRQEDGRITSPTHRFNLERPSSPTIPLIEELYRSLKVWEEYVSRARHDACDSPAIIDCAFWPVLNDIKTAGFEGLSEERYPNLLTYHRRMLTRKCVKSVIDS